MFQVALKVEADGFRRSLRRLGRVEGPKAVADALNFTAFDARFAIRRRLEQVIDRPTRFTMNAFKVVKASPRDPEAIVGFRDSKTAAGFRSYLEPLEFGGPRPPKRFERRLRARGILGPNEFAVPAKGVRFNGSGNLPAAVYVQILSQLGALNTAGIEARGSRRGARAPRKDRVQRKFFAVTRERLGSALPRGIYQRVGPKLQDAKLILIFVQGGPTYRPVLGFRDTVNRVARERLPLNLQRAIDRAIRAAQLKNSV